MRKLLKYLVEYKKECIGNLKNKSRTLLSNNIIPGINSMVIFMGSRVLSGELIINDDPYIYSSEKNKKLINLSCAA